MIDKGDRIIVGVSAGADSVCLLYMLLFIQKHIPVDICIVHIEHGIRGKDSIEDAEFVEKLAHDKGIKFRMFSYDVISEAKKRNIGTEEMGRILRYQSFERAAEQVWGSEATYRIAVAHNKNDNAETVLLNLFRGSGLKGMTGIPYKRGNIIRPLIETSRNEIESWLKSHDIAYRTDSTNFETEYTRNKIRLKVLPYVQEEINNQSLDNICHFSDSAREAYEYIEKQIQKAYDKYVLHDDDIFIKDECLNEEMVIIKGVVKCSIEKAAQKSRDITRKHIEDVTALFFRQTGRMLNLSEGIEAKRVYGGIKIYKNKENHKDINTECRYIDIKAAGEYVFMGKKYSVSVENWEKNQFIPEKIYTKWFDYDKIKGALQLRNKKPKDYLQINKEGHNKKLKAYFTDEKIPKEERDDIMLLADGSHIIWIVGYRISEAYKITEDTKKVIKVQLMDE